MALIKIDIDKPYDSCPDWDEFNKRICFIRKILRINFKSTLNFRSEGGNIHVVIETGENLNDLEICCIQVILGSDWMRETYNLRRIRRGQRNWNILFEHEEVKMYV